LLNANPRLRSASCSNFTLAHVRQPVPQRSGLLIHGFGNHILVRLGVQRAACFHGTLLRIEFFARHAPASGQVRTWSTHRITCELLFFDPTNRLAYTSAGPASVVHKTKWLVFPSLVAEHPRLRRERLIHGCSRGFIRSPKCPFVHHTGGFTRHIIQSTDVSSPLVDLPHEDEPWPEGDVFGHGFGLDDTQ
jgi:hypothetical protein